MPYRYPSLQSASDAAHAAAFKNRCLLDNDPEIFIRTYHGHNVWNRETMLKGEELSFTPKEVQTMLAEYAKQQGEVGKG
jgi:hypothetical protein